MARKKVTEAENTAINETSTAAEAEAETATVSEAETIENTSDKATEKQTEEIKYIYVGATLPGIKTNTVFTGKIPEKLNAQFVRELVIPLNKFTEFKKKKAITDSREAFCYRKSVEYAKTLQK